MDVPSSATVAKPSLRLGGHTINVDEAWKFGATQIFAELDKAIDGDSRGNTKLGTIRDFIRNLSLPDGDLYTDQNLRPPQYIARKRQKKRRKDRKKNYELQIDKKYLTNDGTPYWGLCDMLGLLISLLAEVPQDATTENYYLHITALYARWCRRLIASGKKDLPAAFCSVWVPLKRSGNSRPNYGLNFLVRVERFKLLDTKLIKKSGYNLFIGPSGNTKRVRRAIPLGNCAETYPFAYLEKHHRRSWENVHGVTLRKEATEHDNYCINDITPYFLDSCLNCSWYIERRGGKPGNFKVAKEAKEEGKKRGRAL